MTTEKTEASVFIDGTSISQPHYALKQIGFGFKTATVIRYNDSRTDEIIQPDLFLPVSLK